MRLVLDRSTGPKYKFLILLTMLPMVIAFPVVGMHRWLTFESPQTERRGRQIEYRGSLREFARVYCSSYGKQCGAGAVGGRLGMRIFLDVR